MVVRGTAPSPGTAGTIAFPPGTRTKLATEIAATPPKTALQDSKQQPLQQGQQAHSHHHPTQPARPYARIQLTVEPDSFVLQAYYDKEPEDGQAASKEYATTGAATTKDLVQVLFKVLGGETEQDQGADTQGAAPTKEDSAPGDPATSASFPGLTEGHHGRVSFLTPGSYTRSESARDYLIYGCVGLLDLYTGPHLIVITSVKPLGDIEDMPVYAISKVAVLPMDALEARQVLDKLAQWIDPSTGPIVHVQQESEQSTAAGEEHVAEGELREELAAQPPVSSKPKIRFSFLGLGKDKGLHKSSSSPSLPTSATDAAGAASPPTPKRVSFDIPQLSSGSRSSINLSTPPTIQTGPVASPPSSPMLSPKARASQSGFFSKLMDKKPRKSIDGATPPSSAAVETGESSVKDNNPGNIQLAREPQSDLAKGEKIEVCPPSAPRSPSALEFAEKIVVESSKQIVDWSEDAVSGILKSSPSFALSKPGEQEHVQHTDHSITTTATGTTTDHRTIEEEQEKNRMMDLRVIREISSIFGTGFYFSTELNLLSSKQKRSEQEKDEFKKGAPLWKQVDRRFWWNEHLLEEFLEIEANGYILPVMQGYVEIEQCEIEEQPFEFTLISRRSRERSGLRYQRRGIDEHGNTANFVETEQLLRIVRDDSDHQVSFVQTRGSIPVFWSQSPYRLKPIPIMERTEQENTVGFKKHVDSQMNQYGRQIFINLVEQHGRELIAGSAYTHHVEKLAEPQVRYVEFDFHEQCRGMKYENIERLIKSLEAPVLELGYCWLAPRKDNHAGAKDESFERLYDQKGVIRTNCMDCLDRTNVVQSAIGRHILNHQLLRLGIASFPDKGLSVYEDFENVFNHVWANNGDAISREYAGTSALKGDFTRTGKRNLQGMINDATNSMARMYQNTFKDYFRQAAIDYLLGAADVNVFKNLQTTPFGTVVVPPPILPPTSTAASIDGSRRTLLSASAPELPALAFQEGKSSKSSVLLPSLIPHPSISLGSLPAATTANKDASVEPSTEEKAFQQEAWVKIREAAIETSAEIVISPGEEQWKGWTFICCSNEISSALTSVSSPQSSSQSSLQQPGSASNKKSPKKKSPSYLKNKPSGASRTAAGSQAVFYDEKVVLLTERALYICTYDYEMEKVLEFWRLALEKMTGIDKGAYFLTAQDSTRLGHDPLENYGFAVVYRASVGGETLRVNSGSVRNRRMMGSTVGRTPPLEEVPEVDEKDMEQSLRRESTLTDFADGEDPYVDDDGRSARSLLHAEPKEIRSVRFKIVKHPETSIVPYVTSSTTDSGQSKANPSGYRRTAQDCVEWVVTEIVQARCELISIAERGTVGKGAVKVVSKADVVKGGLETPPGQWRELGSGHHDRSPSEEYNFQSPRGARRSSVQVDLVIRDRVLQSLEAAGQLEKHTLKEQEEKNKKPKKPFGGFFSSSKTASKDMLMPPPQQRSEQSSSLSSMLSPASGNKSWLKKFQFGQDTDDESDDEEDDEPLHHTATCSSAIEGSLFATDKQSRGANEAGEGEEGSAVGATLGETNKSLENVSRSSNQSVFAKFKQAVKNL